MKQFMKYSHSILMRTVRTSCALLALSLVACAQNPSLLVTTADATHLDGVWQGEYQCAQGVTGLKLTLDGMQNGQVTGLFEFYPVARNPKVPRGAFTLQGQYNSAGRLELKPERWIRPVPGWNMVGLKGQVQGVQYSGEIPQCKNFNLMKNN